MTAHGIFFFSFWLASLNINSAFIHAAANGMISFFSWVHSIPLCICGICIFFIIHLLRDTEVVSMIWPAWIGVCVSFWIRVLSGCTPRSRISGPYGNSSFLRNRHAILHSGCTHLPPTYSVRGFRFLLLVSSLSAFYLGQRWQLSLASCVFCMYVGTYICICLYFYVYSLKKIVLF